MDTLYAFAGATFDASLGLLARDGSPSVILRPRAAAVLRYLLEHAGELVTKDALLREVWADLVVTENSLTQCVREIRRELGDGDETLLKTVHRRGYILETAVQKAGPRPASANRNPSRRRAIMVLPLVNMGGDPDQDYFAEGLTEDLTIDIGRTPGAHVIGRGTAQTYAGKPVDVREIGLELGVDYVVEGSVRRDGDEIQVSLAVSETADARQVWAERFNARRENLVTLQRTMAGTVSHMLFVGLSGVEADRPRSPDEMTSHDLATRAYSIWYRNAPQVSAEAARLLDRALELDPQNANALAQKAGEHIFALATRNYTDWDATIAAAQELARKAITLDPENRTAYSRLGEAYAYQGRFEEALTALEQQMQLNPNDPTSHQWEGIIHILMGNAHLAIKPLEAALALSPRDPRTSTFIRNLALAYLHMNQDAQALIIAERSIHQPKPWPRSYETLAAAYAVNGLMEEARAAVKVLLRHWPGYSINQHRAEMMSARPAFLAQRERLLAALREAGLPER